MPTVTAVAPRIANVVWARDKPSGSGKIASRSPYLTTGQQSAIRHPTLSGWWRQDESRLFKICQAEKRRLMRVPMPRYVGCLPRRNQISGRYTGTASQEDLKH